jgi:S1-C subfamily serine protease
MGVVLQNVTSGFRSQTGYHGQGGVAVVQVASGSPADQAGINPGDVILKMNGKSYNDNQALVNDIGKMHSGQKVSLEIWSQGAKRLVQLTLGARPSGSGYEQQPPDQQNPDEQAPPDQQP